MCTVKVVQKIVSRYRWRRFSNLFYYSIKANTILWYPDLNNSKLRTTTEGRKIEIMISFVVFYRKKHKEKSRKNRCLTNIISYFNTFFFYFEIVYGSVKPRFFSINFCHVLYGKYTKGKKINVTCIKKCRSLNFLKRRSDNDICRVSWQTSRRNKQIDETSRRCRLENKTFHGFLAITCLRHVAGNQGNTILATWIVIGCTLMGLANQVAKKLLVQWRVRNEIRKASARVNYTAGKTTPATYRIS